LPNFLQVERIEEQKNESRTSKDDTGSGIPSQVGLQNSGLAPHNNERSSQIQQNIFPTE
jgi:hypothetical protein